MRTPQLADNLRRAVLQAAIAGKLNDRTSEDARDLLAAIQAEKAALQKTGKLKKDKPLAAINEEEIPFAIPENWVWVRLSNLCHSIPSKPYQILQKETQTTGIYPVVSQSKNMIEGYSNEKDKLFSEVPVIIFGDHTRVIKLIDFEFIVGADGTKILKPILTNEKYIEFALKALTINMVDRGYSRHFQFIKDLPIPLPPLAEQQQIVEKLNCLLAEIDELKTQEQALLATQNAFPKKLRAALLQAAVQGELNERTNENARDLLAAIQAEKTALQKAGKLKKDKPLAAISEEEIPFTIPENWVWVRLGDLCQYVQRGKSPQYSDIQQYPVISQKCVQWTGFDIIPAKFIDPKSISSYSDERILRNDDLLWNSTGTGTVGRIVKYHTDFNPYSLAVADSHVTILRLFSCINVDYIEAFIKSPTIQSNIEDLCTGSTKQKELSLGTITNLPIPLPPLTEQQQIVAKLEALLAEIDTLENAA